MSSEIRTLSAARNAATFCIPNHTLREIIITRVFVRTGINLREIHSDQESDSTIVAKILSVFQDLGYPLSGDNDEHDQNA